MLFVYAWRIGKWLSITSNVDIVRGCVCGDIRTGLILGYRHTSITTVEPANKLLVNRHNLYIST